MTDDLAPVIDIRDRLEIASLLREATKALEVILRLVGEHPGPGGHEAIDRAADHILAVVRVAARLRPDLQAEVAAARHRAVVVTVANLEASEAAKKAANHAEKVNE